MSRPRFTFGSYVHCRAKCRLVWKGEAKHLVREECDFKGWVVGAVRRFEGTLSGDRRSARNAWGEYDYDPPGLKATKSHFFWRVASSLMGKPIEVLDDDIESATTTLAQAPLRLGQKWEQLFGPHWTAENQREEVASYPRDVHGKWLKKKK